MLSVTPSGEVLAWTGLAALLLLCATVQAAELPWAGQGRYRIVVTVDPVKLDGRDRDERPARVEVDFAKLLAQWGVHDLADPSTIQIIRHGADGQPVPYGKFAFARSPADLPFRFDEWTRARTGSCTTCRATASAAR